MLPALKTNKHSSSPAFEPLLDLQEAALVLGMHWKTLESKARQHEVPALKVGKRWRFRLSSLNTWLDSGLKSNTTTEHAVPTGREQHP
jgi:excisionase family DNA binding protein